ncbi:MAG: SDR family NAD(P)-dependent oxidoreductase [Chitinophagaceae bacterium]
MNTTNNTVLITGGGSGIGFETALLLAGRGNRVIITGRNKEKLEKAAALIPGATAIVADITDEIAVNSLVERIQREFPDLNMLFNNAAHAVAYTLSPGADAYTKAAEEFNTNVLAVIRLTEKFWPLLEKQPQAAIVNITSIVSMVPGLRVPTYSATKAALHSYSQSLRVALSATNVKVFEVMPPLVDTAFAKELSGSKMPPAEVASEIINGISGDIYEIHVGVTAAFRQLFLQSPETALKHLNNLS